MLRTRCLGTVTKIALAGLLTMNAGCGAPEPAEAKGMRRR